MRLSTYAYANVADCNLHALVCKKQVLLHMVCGFNFVDCQLALGIRGVCVGAFLCVSSTLVAFNLNCLHGYNSVCAAQVCDANGALLV